MNHRLFAGLSAGALTLAACGNNNTPPFTGAFRVVNGITDSTTLDASIANIPTDSQNIQFGTASQIADIPEGRYDAQLTPSDSSKKFSVDNVKIDQNNVTTVFSAGTLAGGTQTGFTIEQSLDSPSNGQITVQVIDSAYQASQPSISNTVVSLEFVFQAPGEASCDLSCQTMQTVSFGQSAAVSQLSSGKFRILVYAVTVYICAGSGTVCNTPAAPAPTLLFDSGAGSGVRLPTADGSNVFQLAALDATSSESSTYGAPIALLLLDNNGSNTPLFNGQN